MDAQLGEGRYETTKTIQGCRETWMLARLPHQYIISGDEITPYLMFMNAHDRTGLIKVAQTPIRVVCKNTLNMTLANAKRSWSCNYTGDVDDKMTFGIDDTLYQVQRTSAGYAMFVFDRKHLFAKSMT